MYEIITAPNPILLEKAKEVHRFDNKLKKILTEMEKSLRATSDPVGVGLAAPQVGLSLRIFQMKPTEESNVTSYINPVIESVLGEVEIPNSDNSKNVENKKPSKSQGRLLEGCLSLPTIWGHVARNNELILSWQDEQGTKQKETFKGFEAIIIQHEVDHLNGILFTKRAMEQGETLYKSSKDKKGEEVFEEVSI